jgi:tRNA threonylcarbamoyladenosine biosynthesis protein TsaE
MSEAAGEERLIMLDDQRATERLAGRLAERAEPGDVIGLKGALGAGKTTFARGFINAVFGPTEVPSPTFTLVQSYEGDQGAVWHLDLYRLTAPEEAEELGLDEARRTAVLLIEWPERLGRLMPPDWLEIELAPGRSEAGRQARLKAHGARASALLGSLDEALA